MKRIRIWACLASILGPAYAGTSIQVTQYNIPTRDALEYGITGGPDGAIWFTENAANQIGRMTLAGTFTEYPIPTPESDPFGIVGGPDGALWFTERHANKIGRVTTSGSFSEYPLPNPSSAPFLIAAGSDGTLWFTEQEAARVGRITTAGTITEYAVSNSTNGITAGPDDAIWFTEERFGGGLIGRITADGTLTQFPVSKATPTYIAAGSDGALWFTQTFQYTDSVGRMTTSGVVTEYSVPNPEMDPIGPAWITAGADGSVWFTKQHGILGRVTPEGLVTMYPVPGDGFPRDELDLEGLAQGPDGALWAAAAGTSRIVRAPACGLGFRANFAGGTLTMNYQLSTFEPATFNITLRNASGPFAQPFSESIPQVAPPRKFQMEWSDFANIGTITVEPHLMSSTGGELCAEWTTVDTSQLN